MKKKKSEHVKITLQDPGGHIVFNHDHERYLPRSTAQDLARAAGGGGRRGGGTQLLLALVI